ncbi:MAG: sensor histidine kinase [Uliginosibacterium sp.]|nr:sensor histidine kinase [Uliginosibacterium sp.]
MRIYRVLCRGFWRSLPVAISREVDLALEAPEELNWRVKIESFQSILHNLIDNALPLWARVGGQVVVSLEETADSIQLSVADDGPASAC